MAKSVNFLTFYEPSEFHNLEPVRVVLCTRKVSALALRFPARSFSSRLSRPRSLLTALSRKTARGKRGWKARCVQRIIAR